jgi:hypothetical protein
MPGASQGAYGLSINSGNAAVNTLQAGAGNDRRDGGLGADIGIFQRDAARRVDGETRGGE